jgi:hypothetical protein
VCKGHLHLLLTQSSTGVRHATIARVYTSFKPQAEGSPGSLHLQHWQVLARRYKRRGGVHEAP